MILLIDNYDSFTHNLAQLASLYDGDVRTVRNDEITIDEIKKIRPSHIIISPGPGHPGNAGISEQVVLKIGPETPVLGVCLGHQAICEAYGGNISPAKKLMHGKKSAIQLDNSCPVFFGLPEKIEGARYHSLAVEKNTLPPSLITTAEDEDGEIMAVRHREYDIYGLQFHPESILTPLGYLIIKNFLNINKSLNERSELK